MNIAALLDGVATLSWLVAIGALGFAVFNAARGRKFAGGAVLVVSAVVAAILLTSVAAGLVFLQADEYGVVISALQPNGYRAEALGPGLHWVVPFVESVRTYSVARQTYTMATTGTEGQVTGDDSIQARTKDGQQVFIDASVIYAVDPAKVINLHIVWQGRYEDNVVRPVSRAAIRDAVSQYGVEEIVSSARSALEQNITDEINQSLTSNNLILTSFLLRNIRFSDEYAAAVEQKQIAEQQAQQAKFVVEQKKQEAEQVRQTAQGAADAAVIAAQGRAQATVLQAEAEGKARVIAAKAEAEALGLISAQLKGNPDLLTFRYIEKLAPNVQIMYLPANSPYLLPLPSGSANTVTPSVAPSTVITP
jgi:regulator of protease activity HflC (stomatin/prohibitin superfamily)